MQSSETIFSRIFESEKYMGLLELSDANLQTDDRCNFAIHKAILSKSNEYFRRMFVGTGKKRRKFHIPGISGACLSDILSYIYTGDIQITERNIVDLIVGADYLQVEDLQKKIREDYIEDILNEVNCSRLLLAAHQTKDEYMFRRCLRIFQRRFEWMMKDDLVHFPVDVLERILSNRSLFVYNETTVWNTIVAWTQKDILSRMSSVPRLLLTLATEDMGEELATEILQHEIISQSCFMNDLAEIRSSNGVSTNIDVLLTLLRNFSNCSSKPILRHRIPSQLICVGDDYEGKQILCISYDETADIWRIFTEVSSKPDALIAIGRNIYMFTYYSDETCKKFDLRAMKWVRMRSFRVNYSVEHYFAVAIDVYIYLLGEIRGLDKHDVQVYNTLNNRWRKGFPLRNISHFGAVAIEKKIYVVGNSKVSDGMMMQMFDPDYKQWSVMSPPTVHHSPFSVVAYHQKIYLIGSSDAEVFDPSTNLWKELPSAFDGRSSPKAIAIGDMIIVFDTDNGRNEVRWNNAQECWEKNTARRPSHDCTFSGHFKFCTIDDVETIRIITKENRNPLAQYNL